MNCIPFLEYEDADGAIDWLESAFGFERTGVHAEEDGTVVHAEMRFDGGMIMLGPARENDWGLKTAQALGAVSQGIYVIVDDIDGHYERSRAGGAEVVRELADTDYGSREYMVRDLEANLWSFGTYRPE